MTAVRTTLRGTGQLLITAGVVILLFCAYELWFTGIYTAHQQAKLKNELVHNWQANPLGPDVGNVPLGDGVAILRIPRLGANYSKVIVEGVATADLKKGPGHYPGTALPGQVGNFVVSGHRTTYGAPFNRLDEVRPGDPIVIETRHRWITYTEVKEIVITPDESWVLEPVPWSASADLPWQESSTPHLRLLTFTTCNPKYSASQRLVLFGKFQSAQPKSQGLPPALAQET
jgi:sortase A